MSKEQEQQIVDYYINTDTYKLIGQDEVSKIYSFPKSYICYYKPREMSEEQREHARARMHKINSV